MSTASQPSAPSDLQAALVAAQTRLTTVIEQAPDAFVAMTADGRVTVWNRRAQQLFGWSPEEAIGATVAELIVPADLRDAHRAGIKRFLRTGEGRVMGHAIEVQARHRDGTLIDVELRIAALDEPDGTTFTAFLRPR